ncbi:MAG: ribosome hibernation-promoting factor, HPF/YfiA family, partial [Anaerolineae bacterium]
VQKKIGKLDRYLPTIDEARVELSVEQAKSNQDRQVVQVTLRSNSTILRAEERSSDMLAAIDAVRDKLQRQIKRYKERPMRIRERARAAAAQAEEQAEELPPRIVRVKRFNVTPMDEEEAIEQMELLGHDFFIFFNPNTGSMNVLYRRKDGNYGLLQPELA